MEGVAEIVKKDGMKYSVRKNRDRIFLPSEWIKFFDALKKSQKITFDFLINTGARINEARHVKVKDIDFKNRLLILKVTKRRNNYADGKPRTIPISNKFISTLKKYIEEKNLSQKDYLGILSTPAAHICMKKTLKKIGINDWHMFSIHNIRKTLESWLLATNVDGLKLCKHFGHSQNTALRYYLKDARQEINQIRNIVGNLYYTNGDIDKLYDKVKEIEEKIFPLLNKNLKGNGT